MALNLGEIYGVIGMDVGPMKKGLDAAEKKLKDFSGSAPKLAAVAGLAIGAAIGAAVVNGIRLEPVKDKMAASLGLVGADADRVGRAAGKAFQAGWGESMDEAAAATGAVISSLPGMRDATEDALADMTGMALAFSQTFEVDTGRAVQVVGQMMRTGLVKDANEGLDLLTRTMQKVPANVREDIMDAVDEYGPFFQRMGIDGTQAMNMLAKGAEKGMYGIDKTGDAVKEFTIRSTDLSKTSSEAYASMGLNAQDMSNKLLAGGDTARNAMMEITDGLLSIKDPAKQAEAAIALFGTPIEDLGVHEIPAFLESLVAAEDVLGDTAGAAGQMAATLSDNAASNIETFKRSIVGIATEALGGWLIPKINDATASINEHFIPGLRAAIDWLSENGATIGAFATTLGILTLGIIAFGIQAKIAAAGGLIQFLTSAATATKAYAAFQWLLNAAMNANPIGLIVLGLAALVAGLVYAWQHSETFRNVVLGVWEAVSGAAMGFVNWFVGTALPWLQGAWESIKGFFQAGADWIGGVFRTAWGVIETIIVEPLLKAWGAIQAVWGVISGFLLSWGAWLSSVFQAAWGILTVIIEVPMRLAYMGLKAIWDGVVALFTWAWEWVSGTFMGWWRLLQPYVTAVMDKVRTDIDNAWNRIKGIFTALWNWVSGWFMGQYRTLERLIRTVMDAVQAGIDFVWTNIKNIFTGVWNWITGWFTPMWDKLTDFLMKPVRMAAEGIGKFIDGIKEAFRVAVEFIKEHWDKIGGIVKAPVRIAVDAMNFLIRGFAGVGSMVGIAEDRLPKEISYPPGFDRGGYTGDGDPRNVAGLVHKKEFVIKADSTQKLIRQHGMGFLEVLNRDGVIPGHAAGGLVGGGGSFTPRFAQALLEAQRLYGGQFSIYQRGFRPATSYSGTSHQADAVDLTPTNLAAVAALRQAGVAAWDRTGKGNWAPHIHGVPLPGYGQPGGSAVWQAQDYLKGGDGLGGRDNGPRGGAIAAVLANAAQYVGASASADGSQSGFWDALTSAWDWVKGAATKALQPLAGLGDSFLAQVIKSIPPKLLEALKNMLTGQGDDASPVSGSQQQVANALMEAGKALNASRQAMKIALMTVFQESSMQPDSTPDENGDSGLFQNRSGRGDGSIAQLNDPMYALRLFLYGKQMPGGYKLPSLYDQPGWATKPEWQAAAWVQRPAKRFETYYQKHESAAEALLNGFRGNGYANGTLNAISGWRAVGEGGEPEIILPPGALHRFSGGEKVMRTAGMGGMNFTYSPVVEAGRDPKKEFDDVMFEFRKQMDRRINA